MRRAATARLEHHARAISRPILLILIHPFHVRVPTASKDNTFSLISLIPTAIGRWDKQVTCYVRRRTRIDSNSHNFLITVIVQ